MPNVTTTGNIDKTKKGFEFLGNRQQKQALQFSGSTLPTTLQVGMLNDVLAFTPFANGTVAALPDSVIVHSAPPSGIVINVSGGSPDFNISPAGSSGPISQ